MSTESVMPSSHLIHCCPLLLLPSIPPSIRVFGGWNRAGGWGQKDPEKHLVGGDESWNRYAGPPLLRAPSCLGRLRTSPATNPIVQGCSRVTVLTFHLHHEGLLGPVDQPWAALLEADPKGAVSALLGPAQGYHGIVIATVLPGVVELVPASLV